VPVEMTPDLVARTMEIVAQARTAAARRAVELQARILAAHLTGSIAARDPRAGSRDGARVLPPLVGGLHCGAAVTDQPGSRSQNGSRQANWLAGQPNAASIASAIGRCSAASCTPSWTRPTGARIPATRARGTIRSSAWPRPAWPAGRDAPRAATPLPWPAPADSGQDVMVLPG